MPFTSFSENETLPDGKKPPVRFAFDETRPLALFAVIRTRWTSVRKVKEGETTNDLYAFLMTEPNKEVEAIRAKATSVILTTAKEIDIWKTAPAAEAFKLQRPLPGGALKIVSRGAKKEGEWGQPKMFCNSARSARLSPSATPTASRTIQIEFRV